jgi:uncharacterized protein
MHGKFKGYYRFQSAFISSSIGKGHSILVLGPRQVGKTWIIEHCIKNRDRVMEIPLQHPAIRQEFERDPSILIRRVETKTEPPLIFIDEIQKVPELFDAIQFLIDKKMAVFLLSGSSARKIRRKGTNLLPGRVIALRLDPLSWNEAGFSKDNIVPELSLGKPAPAGDYKFLDSLVFGALPGIASLAEEEDRVEFLRSYSQTYIEEEIRAEALSRKIGAFSRFLELAAIESGTAPVFSNIAMETGVTVPTVKEFFSILVDTLIAERVDPFVKKARKRLFHGVRYYFFDIGVRNALARAPLTKDLFNVQKGLLFEHAVMLEIIRRARSLRKDYKICYWRTSNGQEVDCILDCGDHVVPIEIKSAKRVSLPDVGGLTTFLQDYPDLASKGYVITMADEPEKLTNKITAIPWQYL